MLKRPWGKLVNMKTKEIKSISVIVGFPLLALVLWLLVGVLVLGNWWKDIKGKQDQIKIIEGKVEAMVPKLDLLNAQNIDDLQTYSIELNIAIPRRIVAPVILASVENEISDSGMILDNIYFTGVTKSDTDASGASKNTDANGSGKSTPVDANTLSDGSGIVGVSIGASGEMYQVLDAIKKLQNTLPLMKVDSISITSADVNIANTTEDESAPEQLVPGKRITLTLGSPFEGLADSIGAPSDPILGLSKSDKKILEQLATFSSLYDQKTIDPQSEYQSGKNNPF